MRTLDSFRFGFLCSLCSASFFFSSHLLLCVSAALLSFCEASASETVIATDLCSTLRASPALPSGYERITDGLVVAFRSFRLSDAVASAFSAFFPLFVSSPSLLFISCHFELRIGPSHHHPIVPSILCVSFPGPAECAKRLNKKPTQPVHNPRLEQWSTPHNPLTTHSSHGTLVLACVVQPPPIAHH